MLLSAFQCILKSKRVRDRIGGQFMTINHCIMLMWWLAGPAETSLHMHTLHQRHTKCTAKCVGDWLDRWHALFLHFPLKKKHYNFAPSTSWITVIKYRLKKKMLHWHIKRFLRFHLSNENHKNLIKVFKRSNFAKMHFGSEHFAHHSRMLTLMEKLAVAQYSSGSQPNVNLHSWVNSSSLKMLFPEKKEKTFKRTISYISSFRAVSVI